MIKVLHGHFLLVYLFHTTFAEDKVTRLEHRK